MENHSNNLPSGKDVHHNMAIEMPPVKIAIVTVSDSRTEDTDINGQYLKQQILAGGLVVSSYWIVKDDQAAIESILETLAHSEAQVLLFNGGTGISKRDTTYDVIAKKLKKAIPGFGELFRMLSYEQVGPAAMFSRAIAGIYQDKVIISTPGSPAAVQLAWEKLIAPEIRHLAWEVSR